MTDRQRLETTYADLRPDDQIEDKSGNRWLIAELQYQPGPNRHTFWLCDLTTNVKMYQLAKNAEDPVTVWRLPKHADQVAKLEDEFPSVEVDIDLTALSELADKLGATVDLEVAAAEIDAAIEAEDTGLPIELPAFADLDDLSKRSHLYVMHGTIAYDLQSRAQLADTHAQLEAGKVAGRFIPHTHAPESTK